MTVLLVAVLCAPGIAGRTTAGVPHPAVHIPPRPVPGDCIGPLHTPEELNSPVDLVPVVPCSQPHSAEILSVQTLDPQLFPRRPGPADPVLTQGSLGQQCDQLAAAFLGWGTKNSDSRLTVGFFTKVTVPGDVAWSLGHRWATCESLPQALDLPISYQGTARNADHTTPPAAFAACADEPGELIMSCERPHHAEQLTLSFQTPPLTATECLPLVGAVIGTADPTFGGALAVLSRVRGGASACWVVTTSSRVLTTTLINHGAGSLPLR